MTLSTGLLLGCQDKSSEQPKGNLGMKQNQNTEMKHADHDHDSVDMASNTAYFTCPMESHKHINSQEPGSCPECGMTLVPVIETSPTEAEFYGCPMPEHSHVRAENAGPCPECGMQLKPMKLAD